MKLEISDQSASTRTGRAAAHSTALCFCSTSAGRMSTRLLLGARGCTTVTGAVPDQSVPVYLTLANPPALIDRLDFLVPLARWGVPSFARPARQVGRRLLSSTHVQSHRLRSIATPARCMLVLLQHFLNRLLHHLQSATCILGAATLLLQDGTLMIFDQVQPPCLSVQFLPQVVRSSYWSAAHLCSYCC